MIKLFANKEILVPDWLITSHVTSITSSDWLFASGILSIRSTLSPGPGLLNVSPSPSAAWWGIMIVRKPDKEIIVRKFPLEEPTGARLQVIITFGSGFVICKLQS